MHDSRAKHFFSYEALKDYKIDSVWRFIYKHKNIADNFSFKKIINKKNNKKKGNFEFIEKLKIFVPTKFKNFGSFLKISETCQVFP